MKNIAEIGSAGLKPRKNIVNQNDMLTGAHYGTQISINSNGAGTTQKKYSQSVTRRNHTGLQETASGNNFEGDSQEHSQQSSKNFNSLRNSKSMGKKMSATGTKKAKKLKKSESQARHQ